MLQFSEGKLQEAQKVVIYGPEGIGKSTIASFFPNPVFFDIEGSTGKLDVKRVKPAAMSLTMLVEQFNMLLKDPSGIGTVVIDTADKLEFLCRDHVLSKANKTGIEDFGYGKGYTYLEEEFGKFLNLSTEIICRKINVVYLAHAQMRKFEQPDEMGAYDRWELKLQKKTAPLLKEWADMVLFANYKTLVVEDDKTKSKKATGGKRIMHTSHHPCWDAKNRDGLPDVVEFSYESIRHCIPDFTQISSATTNTKNPPVEPKPVVQTNMPVSSPVKNADTTHTTDNTVTDLSHLPKELVALMQMNNVTEAEIQAAVAKRGYYPIDTPISNYEDKFIKGVLVAAWSKVYQVILSIRGGN